MVTFVQNVEMMLCLTNDLFERQNHTKYQNVILVARVYVVVGKFIFIYC